MLWITCPNCGRRPVEEFAFGGEFPSVPDRITDGYSIEMTAKDIDSLRDAAPRMPAETPVRWAAYGGT